MRISRPCSVEWDSMSGDDRARFCRECDRQVYNLSLLTRDEIGSLVPRRDYLTQGRNMVQRRIASCRPPKTWR